MKKLLYIIGVFYIICGLVLAAEFDNRGVWQAISLSSDSLAAGVQTISGIIDVSDREPELNIIVTGESPDDSLVIKLDLYGLATPNLADSADAVSIHSATSFVSATSLTFADTLDGDEMFPYLWIKLTNSDLDSTVSVDAYLYMKQRDITILQRR